MRNFNKFLDGVNGQQENTLRQVVQSTPSVSQAQVFATYAEGKSMFLAGDAGTGKSFVTKQFIDDFKNTVADKDLGYQLSKTGILVTASTGIAAANIGGRTIHSVSGLGKCKEKINVDRLQDPIYRKKLELSPAFDKCQKVLKTTKMIILDEVSMVDATFIDNLSTVLQIAKDNKEPFGGVTMVFVGDFMQLPPVSGTRFAFESEEWKRLNPEMLYMQTPQRSTDPKLDVVLSDMRKGDISDETCSVIKECLQRPNNDHYVRLFTTNRNVDNYNNRKLAEIDEPPVDLPVEFTVDGNCNHPDVAPMAKTLISNFFQRMSVSEKDSVLTVKKGAVVMITTNHVTDLEGQQLVNGDTGVITDIDNETGDVTVNVNRLGRDVVINRLTQTENTKPITDRLAEPEYTTNDKGEQVKKRAKSISGEVSFSYMPLKVAFATTVHKSQGQTLDGVVVDLEECFAPNLGYVAMSRVTDSSRLCITNIKESAFYRDPRCVRFSENLVEQSQRNREKFLNRPDLEQLEERIRNDDIISRNFAWMDTIAIDDEPEDFFEYEAERRFINDTLEDRTHEDPGNDPEPTFEPQLKFDW